MNQQKHSTLWIGSMVLIISAVWITITALFLPTDSVGQIPAPKEGFLAPGFTLTNMDNHPVQLSDFQGQVVLVNFWASWCPPCRAEMPALQSIYDDYQINGFNLLAINATSSDAYTDAIDFLGENNLTFPVLFDYSGEVSHLYRAETLPRSFLIDQNGMIQDITIGQISESVLRSKIESLLNENP